MCAFSRFYYHTNLCFDAVHDARRGKFDKPGKPSATCGLQGHLFTPQCQGRRVVQGEEIRLRWSEKLVVAHGGGLTLALLAVGTILALALTVATVPHPVATILVTILHLAVAGAAHRASGPVSLTAVIVALAAIVLARRVVAAASRGGATATARGRSVATTALTTGSTSLTTLTALTTPTFTARAGVEAP